MMQMQALAMLRSTSTTEEAKAIALRIEHDASLLADALRTRNDSK